MGRTMARTRKTLPAKVDIAHLIGAGVLDDSCKAASEYDCCPRQRSCMT